MLNRPPINIQHISIKFDHQNRDRLDKVEKGILNVVDASNAQNKKAALWLRSTKSRASGCFPALASVAVESNAQLTWVEYHQEGWVEAWGLKQGAPADKPYDRRAREMMEYSPCLDYIK